MSHLAAPCGWAWKVTSYSDGTERRSAAPLYSFFAPIADGVRPPFCEERFFSYAFLLNEVANGLRKNLRLRRGMEVEHAILGLFRALSECTVYLVFR